MTRLTRDNTPSWSYDPHRLVVFATLAEFGFCFGAEGIAWVSHPTIGTIRRRDLNKDRMAPDISLLSDADFWKVINRICIGMLPPLPRNSHLSPSLPDQTPSL